MNAVGLALWLPRIPDVKEQLNLDVWVVALCLMGAPVGTMIGFFFAAKAVRQMGLRRTCIIVGPAMCIALILPAAAPTPFLLFAGLLVVGITIAVIEVAMNSKANVVQHESGRRIMSRCHGMWSFGVMFGGLVAGSFAQNQIGPFPQQIFMEPLAAVFAILFAMALPADSVRDEVEESSMALPSGPLLILCLVPITALLIEGAMLDWSVLFLRDEVFLSSFEASAMFSVFAMAMGFGRLGGDWATDRIGIARMMIWSGFAMGIGIALFAISGSMLTAAPGALLAGLGAANIYPLALSLAPDVAGGTPERNVASIALSAFTAFLIGPPLIGFVAEATSLSTALLILGPAGLIPIIFVLSGAMNGMLGGKSNGKS